MDDCELLGAHVRSFYIEKKSSLMRKKYRPGPRWDKPEVWNAAGEACIRLGANPRQLVNAVFEFDKNKDGPFPNIFLGEAVNSRWNSYKKRQGIPENNNPRDMSLTEVDNESAQEIAHWWIMLELITKKKGLHPDNLHMLCLPYCSIPAWVRIAMAPDDKEVARLYKEKARPDFTPDRMNELRALGIKINL